MSAESGTRLAQFGQGGPGVLLGEAALVELVEHAAGIVACLGSALGREGETP